MEAQWIHQRDIDSQKWDKLVDQTEGATIYVRSFYLDATAIEWEAYIAADYSFAIPVGVTKKGGVSRVYPPLFQRYIEPIGNIQKIDWEAFEKSIKRRFKKGNLNFRSNEMANTNAEVFVHQTVNAEQFKLKTQAKRMIKRFSKSDYSISTENINTKALLDLISQELAKKMPIYAKKEVLALYELVEEAEKRGFLYKVGIFEDDELKGGLIGLVHNNRLIYLKGTSFTEIQKEGGMYALMQQLVEYGLSHDLLVDFGGSKVKGIQFFNSRFSSIDVKYYHFSWDHSPRWFQLLYSMYQRFRK